MKKSYLNLEKTTFKKYLNSLIAVAMLFVVASSCEKQGEESFSDLPTGSSTQRSANVSAMVTTASLSKQQALNQFNYLFKEELRPIKLEQIQGINKQQFVEWLRTSKIVAAEQQYLGPLLSSSVSEIILLKNVTLLNNGSTSTFALVAVPTQLYSHYSKVIVLQENTNASIARPCTWFECDNMDPNMCLCLYRIGSVPINQNCPASECSGETGCTNSSGSPCTGNLLAAIKTF